MLDKSPLKINHVLLNKDWVWMPWYAFSHFHSICTGKVSAAACKVLFINIEWQWPFLMFSLVTARLLVFLFFQIFIPQITPLPLFIIIHDCVNSMTPSLSFFSFPREIT
jgi:hypothetical protein